MDSCRVLSSACCARNGNKLRRRRGRTIRIKDNRIYTCIFWMWISGINKMYFQLNPAEWIEAYLTVEAEPRRVRLHGLCVAEAGVHRLTLTDWLTAKSNKWSNTPKRVRGVFEPCAIYWKRPDNKKGRGEQMVSCRRPLVVTMKTCTWRARQQ